MKAATFVLDAIEEKMETGEFKNKKWILLLDQSGRSFECVNVYSIESETKAHPFVDK